AVRGADGALRGDELAAPRDGRVTCITQHCGLQPPFPEDTTMDEYQHRVCKCGCGKRIPRWTDGKQTPKSRVFFDAQCSAYYRKLPPQKSAGSTNPAPTTENAILRPIPRAFPKPVCETEGRPAAPPMAKTDYGPCRACGRQQPMVAGQPTYCNDR